jgi:Flp pilus assembly protein TadD
MQLAGADTYRIVYHEYTHLLLRHAGYRVPVWFNEGLAELFSTADVGRDEVRIGALIPAHIGTLRDQRMLDLQTLTAVDHRSPFYNERGKTGIFYAQSWALVHMLNFAPEYRSGVANFVEMILAGEDAVSAFRQAFGKAPAAVIQDLKAYLASGRFEGLRFGAQKLNVQSIKSEPVTSVDTALALADLLATIGKIDAARLAFGKLEAAYPDRPDVLLALGQFAVRLEDFSGARQYLERSIHAGSTSPRVFYEYAIVLRNLGEPQALVVDNLTRAVRLDDRFFEGQYYLGSLHLQAERFIPAIQHLKRATELQPSRLGVWESLAVAFHKAGSKEDARAAATTARRLASGPEDAARIDALLDLIESDVDKIVVAPPGKKADASAAAPPISRVDGVLTQVDCLGKRARLHIAVPGGKVLLLVTNAGSVRLWGAGVTQTELACGPSSPRPVLVEYRPEIHATYGTAGSVISVDFR